MGLIEWKSWHILSWSLILTKTDRRPGVAIVQLHRITGYTQNWGCDTCLDQSPICLASNSGLCQLPKTWDLNLEFLFSLSAIYQRSFEIFLSRIKKMAGSAFWNLFVEEKNPHNSWPPRSSQRPSSAWVEPLNDFAENLRGLLCYYVVVS